MGLVDLHIHSTVSDGKFSPSDIINKSIASGMRTIALTDHDTVNGIQEALNAANSSPVLRVIPGVEISTDVPHGEIHMLGYFIDYNSASLLAKLDNMRNSRVERAKKIVEKLAGLGVKIEYSRVRELASGSSVGRPHIAQAMQEKGYIGNFREAFERYIGRDGPAYVERDKMTPLEAVKLITDSGGLPVFAHPLTFPDYETMTGELVPAGLVGIEVYYKYSTPGDINRVMSLANKYKLIPTGGSDFHGIEANEVGIGGVEVPIESAQRIIALAKERGRVIS